MVFSDRAVFVDARFCGGTSFGGAKFFDGAEFSGAKFSCEADFAEATFTSGIFSNVARFQCASFSGPAQFESVKFLCVAAFERANFSNGVSFLKSAFSSAAKFENANFSGATDFISAAFEESQQLRQRERQAKLRLGSDIQDGTVPSSSGAKLHEGTVWRGIKKWPIAEGKADECRSTSSDAYERLKLEMDRLKKHEDELDFFALELQSRRVEQGLVRGLPIALYGALSDYGRSYVRPFVCAFRGGGVWHAGVLALRRAYSPGNPLASALRIPSTSSASGRIFSTLSVTIDTVSRRS